MGDNLRYDEEEEEEPLPFQGLEKAAVLQRCRVFNAVPLNVVNCQQAMIQILYLLSTGTQLTKDEALDLFFMATKLMQSTDAKLRRLQCILMKELSPLVEQRFIASNSIMNDTKSSNDTTKGNAIRTLYSVMDSTMYTTMDRTISEYCNSRNPNVVTAALVTGIHISHTYPDMTRKWATQLNEVMKERSKAQYPAIALLHKLRKNDRLSVNRLIEQERSGQIRSPLALCLVIKMCTELMQESFEDSLDLYKFVTTMMRNPSDLVAFEATRAICSLRNIGDKEVNPAVQVLQPYLGSHSPVTTFAAISQLNHLSTVHPNAVATINSDIETLVGNPNSIISTLAITSLLKTGRENTIDRLVTQLCSAGYLNSLGDEFKMVVVNAMRVLNVKFPSKYGVLLTFLFKALSEEGSSQLKQNVVDTMIEIAKSNPESNDLVLTHLAEFIDDCEFPHITKRVLMYFGEEVPSSANPKKFVRYVYNHATLEQPEIRAVAISTLAKLAARVPALRRSIFTLLKRACMDSDDEVRDRAVLYTKLFLMGDELTIRTMVDDVANAVASHRISKQAEKQSTNNADIAAAQQVAVMASLESSTNGATDRQRVGSYMSPTVLAGRDEMRKIKQLRELGEPFRSCEPVPLTEADNDYVLSVIKHVYASYLVLQFRVKNTMEGFSLKGLTVVANVEELEAEPLYAIPVDMVEPGSIRYTYVVLQYEPEQFPSGTITCSVRFAMQSSDGDAMDEDEFELESFDVDIRDFIQPADLGATMESKWTEQAQNETAGTYSLRAMRNLTTAANELAKFFGMYVEGGVPERITTNSHTLFMAGTVATATRALVMVQARVFVSTDNSVALQLALRGGDSDLRQYLAEALLS